eukprot:7942999-Ditylum_brightwellii.AAC.1
MGQLHSVIAKPVQLLVQSGSLGDLLAHSPSKSELTKHLMSNPSTANPITMPLLQVPFKYLPILLSAALCNTFGLLEKQAH